MYCTYHFSCSELAFALNKKSADADAANMNVDDDKGAKVMADEKRTLLAQRSANQASDRQFPEEVEYEEEASAQDRYARCRALRSFRKSYRYRDPKENLPETHDAVYHFSSFRATQCNVLEDARDLDLEEVMGRKGWGAHGVKYLPKIDGVANYVLPVMHVELGIATGINSYIEEGVDGVLGLLNVTRKDANSQLDVNTKFLIIGHCDCGDNITSLSFFANRVI